MAWHFFKKDLRLLWPMALALAATQALCAVRTVVLGPFKEPVALFQLTVFLPLLVYLGIALVTINAVHQDALPGVRQDWLTRPVRRLDVWLSKLLFVLLMVMLPIFVIDVIELLSLQLPLRPSIAGAAARTFALFGAFALPALVLGAVTRSFTEALLFGIVAAVAGEGIFILALAALPPGTLNSGAPGTDWVPFACGLAVLAVVSAVTLWFQHTRRRTGVSRLIVLSGVLITMTAVCALPASATMEIQRLTWGRSETPLAVRFAPESRNAANDADARIYYRADPTVNPTAVAAARAVAQAESSRFAKIVLPLRVEGLVPGRILRADQIDARVVAADGTVYFDETRACSKSDGVGQSCRANWLELRARGESEVGNASVFLPAALYERIKNEAVHLELDISLTLFEADPPSLVSTHSEFHPVSHLGSCATRIDADGDEVEIRCLMSGIEPACVIAVLEDSTAQKSNPELQGCFPNYAPFYIHPTSDVANSVRASLPFFDRSGLAHYPVDASAIDRAQIRVTTFTPFGHFRRSLSLQDIRLADWESAQRVNAPLK
jgi:hypothetical protein